MLRLPCVCGAAAAPLIAQGIQQRAEVAEELGAFGVLAFGHGVRGIGCEAYVRAKLAA
jgi:hypothetical protein